MNTMLTFLAVLTMGFQEPNPKVTFEAPGLLVGVALEKLSEASGVRLMASPQTKDQTLIVWVKDVPLQDLMAKIADCAGAECGERGERLPADPHRRAAGGFLIARPLAESGFRGPRRSGGKPPPRAFEGDRYELHVLASNEG